MLPDLTAYGRNELLWLLAGNIEGMLNGSLCLKPPCCDIKAEKYQRTTVGQSPMWATMCSRWYVQLIARVIKVQGLQQLGL
jgi:hypothetical protein